MCRLLHKLRRDEDGGTAIEYGLIACLISLVCITTVQMLGSRIDSLLMYIGTTLIGTIN
jgi:pilus assembly protein Flp/PilA